MKHDIQVGDVWKYRNNDGRLRFPTAKVLFIGDEAVFSKLTTHDGGQYEKTTDIDLFVRSYALIERDGKSIIPVPQGEDLIGSLCGVSNTIRDISQERSQSLTHLHIITSFKDNLYVTTDGTIWEYAYPVDTSKLKQWSPDNA